ncbi:MAG: hypothetical protein ABJR23_01345, partial [Paracoccaceae bacterium]
PKGLNFYAPQTRLLISCPSALDRNVSVGGNFAPQFTKPCCCQGLSPGTLLIYGNHFIEECYVTAFGASFGIAGWQKISAILVTNYASDNEHYDKKIDQIR